MSHSDADRTGSPFDTDLRMPSRPARSRRVPWSTLAVISAGGVLGALARYGITVAFPHPVGGFAWATFIINVTGCLLIGVLMVMISEVWQAPALARPFLGVGVLGGFTTFSTYALDIEQAMAAGAARTAIAYLVVTLIAALGAVWAGSALTRALTRRRRKARP